MQEYGALTLIEIYGILTSLKIIIPEEKINSYLMCAEAVGWIKAEKKGANVYYFSLSLKRDAAQYIFGSDLPEKNKAVRRLAIREFWEETDPDRFRGIAKFSGEMA